MGDGVLALTLMLGGLGCILAWCICQTVAVIHTYRLRRESDALQLHVVNGGRLPDGASSILARDYLRVRWLGIIANILLLSGIFGVALAQFLFF